MFVQAVPTVFLKSQFEYGRGNYEKAVRMLSSAASHVLTPSASAAADAAVRGPLRNTAAMYFNNLGIAHFHLRKHNLGAFYLRRAAEENMATVRETHGGHDDGIFDIGLTLNLSHNSLHIFHLPVDELFNYSASHTVIDFMKMWASTENCNHEVWQKTP